MVIKGISASQGIVRGNARIYSSLADIKRIAIGDILVAKRLKAQDVIAFSKIIGIVVEEGSITQHASIIAREFGIPCIIGAKYATKSIKDGDLVRVNANEGIVRVLD